MALSLPQLQDHIKKEPEAFFVDFERQYAHFQTTVASLKEDHHKPLGNFTELLMFIAHTSVNYRQHSDNFARTLLTIMSENFTSLHSNVQHSIIGACILIRSRKQIPLVTTSVSPEGINKKVFGGLLPIYFDIFRTSDDKELKRMIFRHIVKDIAKRADSSVGVVKAYLVGKLGVDNEEEALRGLGMILELYRRKVFRDAPVVNAAANCVLSKYNKVAIAAALFTTGNMSAHHQLWERDEAEKKKKKVSAVALKIIGARKTRGREQRLQRAKKAAQRALDKEDKKTAFDGNVDFGPIDLLFDPQGFSERLLKRVVKKHEVFSFRLVMITLISRVIARHKLLLPHYYSYVGRYLYPKQSCVTKLLAAFAQACHNEVPPEAIRPIVESRILSSFVSEHQASEVIVVGLNTLREIAQRAPLVLSEESLDYAVSFKGYRDKYVAVGARSLLNLYRDMFPSLLHRTLRGKQANVAVLSNLDARPQFGEFRTDKIKGANLYFELKKRVAALDDHFESQSIRRTRTESGNEESVDGQSNTSGDYCEGVDGAEAPSESEDLDSVSDTEGDEVENEKASESSDEDECPSLVDENAENERNEENDLSSAPPSLTSPLTGKPSNPPVRSPLTKKQKEHRGVYAVEDFDLSSRLLSQTDFEEIQKLQGQISTEEALRGRVKRSVNEFLDEDMIREYRKTKRVKKEGQVKGSDQESDDETACSSSEEAVVEKDLVDPDSLIARTTKKQNLKARAAEQKLADREERRDKRVFRHMDVHKSLPESVKARNKPYVMIRQKQKVRDKRQIDVKSRTRALRQHMKKLKMQTGKRKMFRRG